MLSDKKLLEYLSQWINLNKNITDWQSLTLSRFGSFPAILTASKDELQKGLNLSEKDSANIKLCYEISLRLLKARIYNCNILENKIFLTDYLIAHLSRKQTEDFLIYFLDEEGQIIQETLQGNGTVNATSLYIREVTRSALKCNAHSLILVHNHPSGVAAPSGSDEKLTEMVTYALKVINVQVVDHLIIGNGCFFSFAENNLVIPSNISRLK
ncbi:MULTISPECIES: JAB domain-containing protein [Commensalibacter]|uniref:JAB domain-containing protein n=1 Tax=Commensalibacter TaxID=1079922 RepID=UPI001376E214|nr:MULTISPECIES: JAB domain-containing protein [Commensalibacter]